MPRGSSVEAEMNEFVAHDSVVEPLQKASDFFENLSHTPSHSEIMNIYNKSETKGRVELAKESVKYAMEAGDVDSISDAIGRWGGKREYSKGFSEEPRKDRAGKYLPEIYAERVQRGKKPGEWWEDVKKEPLSGKWFEFKKDSNEAIVVVRMNNKTNASEDSTVAIVHTKLKENGEFDLNDSKNLTFMCSESSFNIRMKGGSLHSKWIKAEATFDDLDKRYKKSHKGTSIHDVNKARDEAMAKGEGYTGERQETTEQASELVARLQGKYQEALEESRADLESAIRDAKERFQQYGKFGDPKIFKLMQRLNELHASGALSTSSAELLTAVGAVPSITDIVDSSEISKILAKRGGSREIELEEEVRRLRGENERLKGHEGRGAEMPTVAGTEKEVRLNTFIKEAVEAVEDISILKVKRMFESIYGGEYPGYDYNLVFEVIKEQREKLLKGES